MIQVDVDSQLVNNMQVMPKPQEKPRVDTKINHKYEVSGGVQDYVLVRDRDNCLTTPP